MNRIDRIAAILIQLQSRRIVKAQDIADRFEISLRTVYRDIRTLEEAGVPILGEAGVGYSIMEGYRLPPVMFTREEATAFLTAEKLVEKFTDPSLTDHYKSAMMKIRSVLRNAEKDLLEGIENNIQVLRIDPASVDTDNGQKRLPVLLEHIASKKRIRIHYTAYGRPEASDRLIEPLGVFFSSGYWHCIAWCLLRNDYRDFRTDRMQLIQSTAEPFTRNHPSLQNYLEKIREQEQLTKIVIRVDKTFSHFMSVQKYYFGFVREEELSHSTEMEFLTNSEMYFLRWFISFADHAVIVEPQRLVDKLAKLLKSLSEKHLVDAGLTNQ